MPMPQYSESDAPPEAPATPPPDPEDDSGDGMDESSGDEHTLFVSPDHLVGCDVDSLKPGDPLKFTVVGKDGDGDIEVKYEHGDSEGSSKMDRMKTELKAHMASPAAGGE